MYYVDVEKSTFNNFFCLFYVGHFFYLFIAVPANTSKIVIFYQTKYVFFLPQVLFGQEWAFWEKV